MFLIIGILGRIYYVQKLANEANTGELPLPQAGQLTKQAGEEGTKALGGN